MDTMQFFYNSGLPQRQRRSGRDPRPNAVNRDVPSFLVYPDGSHLLGVISPAISRPEEDSANQDSTITGPFVVWADPVVGFSPAAQGTNNMDHAYFVRHGFYLLFVVDAIFCSMILADTIANQNLDSSAAINFSMPPLELTAVSFTFGIIAKLTGAWGVYKQRIRHISAFISFGMLLTILNFLWVGALSHLLVISLDVMLLGLAVYVRSLLMGSWFSAAR